MPKKPLDLEEEGEKSHLWLSKIVKILPEILFNKAIKGSMKSAGLLWEIATFSTDYLQKLARKNPEVIKPIAATQHQWPGFIGPHPDVDKHSRDVVDLLGVGSNSKIKLYSKTKIWSQDTYANEVALYYYYLFDTIRTHRRPKPLPSGLCLSDGSPINKYNWRGIIENLPDLTRERTTQWFDAIWDFIMEEYKGHPEKHPPDDPDLFDLWHLGEHREFHAEEQGLLKEQTPGTSAYDIRYGIKYRLKRAFTTIVR